MLYVSSCPVFAVMAKHMRLLVSSAAVQSMFGIKCENSPQPNKWILEHWGNHWFSFHCPERVLPEGLAQHIAGECWKIE